MWTCSDDSESHGIGLIVNYKAPKEDLDLLTVLLDLLLWPVFRSWCSAEASKSKYPILDFLVFKKHLGLFKGPLCKKVESQILKYWRCVIAGGVSWRQKASDVSVKCLGLFVFVWASRCEHPEHLAWANARWSLSNHLRICVFTLLLYLFVFP